MRFSLPTFASVSRDRGTQALPAYGRVVVSARLHLIALALAWVCGSHGLARGQILVSDSLNNTIGQWTTSGSAVNSSWITGLSGPDGIAASGGYLYVANNTNNTIAKYTMSGQLVDASFITAGMNEPTQILASGTDLYVMNTGNSTIGKYTTSGQTVNTAFITLTQSYPYSMALSGTSLFVVAKSEGSHSHSNSFVVQYDTANGGFVGDIIPELPGSPPGFYGLAASATNLYVSFYYTNGFVSEYTTAGSLVNEKFIDNLTAPQNLFLSGSSLYVLEIGTNRIGEYTTSGGTVNAALVTGLSSPFNFTVVPVPEPSTYAMALAGIACGGFSMWRRRKRA
jgi:hypothetical protein